MDIYFQKECFKRLVEILFNPDTYSQHLKDGTNISTYTRENNLDIVEVLRNQEIFLCFEFITPEQLETNNEQNYESALDSISSLLEISREKADYLIKLKTMGGLRFTQNCKLPISPKSLEIEDRLKFFSSVLFIDSDEQDSDLYKGMLVKTSNDIEETLRHLKIAASYGESGILPSCTFYTRNKRWKDMIDEYLPCSDIIIVDPFFFESNDSSHYSSKEILNLLLKHNKKANVVIFCDVPTPREIKDENGKIIRYDSTNYYSIYKELKAELYCSKITFVQHYFKKNERDMHLGIHDRYIITNYRLYLSGHSFSQYFRSGSYSANGGVWFNANSIMETNNAEVIRLCIEKQLQQILNCCTEEDIWGDLSSNFLDLSQGTLYKNLDGRQLFEGKEMTCTPGCVFLEEYNGSTIRCATTLKTINQNSEYHLCNIRKNKKPHIADFIAYSTKEIPIK